MHPRSGRKESLSEYTMKFSKNKNIIKTTKNKPSTLTDHVSSFLGCVYQEVLLNKILCRTLKHNKNTPVDKNYKKSLKIFSPFPTEL